MVAMAILEVSVGHLGAMQSHLGAMGGYFGRSCWPFWGSSCCWPLGLLFFCLGIFFRVQLCASLWLWVAGRFVFASLCNAFWLFWLHLLVLLFLPSPQLPVRSRVARLAQADGHGEGAAGTYSLHARTACP